MSVADVPVRELFGLDLACPDCLPILMLCLHLTLDLLHEGQHRRGGGSSRDEHAVALNVFHVLIIGAMGGRATHGVPLCRLSTVSRRV